MLHLHRDGDRLTPIPGASSGVPDCRQLWKESSASSVIDQTVWRLPRWQRRRREETAATPWAKSRQSKRTLFWSSASPSGRVLVPYGSPCSPGVSWCWRNGNVVELYCSWYMFVNCICDERGLAQDSECEL